MARRFVGIDPGLSCTGVAVLHPDGGLESFAVKTDATQSDFARQLFVVQSIAPRVCGGDVLIFEDFGVTVRFAKSAKLVERVELCGMLKLALGLKSGASVLACSPTHLKKFFTGNGNASKSAVLDAAYRLGGRRFETDDEADAFALAHVGMRLIRGPIDSDVLKAIEGWADNGAVLKRLRFVA